MEDWSAGYVTDAEYTYGYYGELNPLRSKFALLYQGILAPETLTACELGFGQGLSTNIHASASNIKWYGNDFNPAHASFAKEIATLSNNDAQLFDDSFEEFLNNNQLPKFDYICLHGIWSWVNENNRVAITNFIKEKLNVGGIVYISYNALPGSSSTTAIQHLLSSHSQTQSVQAENTLSKVESALSFMDRLIESNPQYLNKNPSAISLINSIKKKNIQYVAHEYFNENWHPVAFNDIQHDLAPAKLTFSCSATYIDHIDAMNLTDSQQQILNEITDPSFKETVRDFIVNKSFRKDYWVKGIQKLSEYERKNLLKAQGVLLIMPIEKINLETQSPLGKFKLDSTQCAPIIDALSHYQITTIGQIESAVKATNISFNQIMQIISAFLESGQIVLSQKAETILSVKEQACEFNNVIIRKSRISKKLNYLASPVTGGGIFATRFEQLFILAITEGLKSPEELATYVWDLLTTQNEKITTNGNIINSKKDSIEHLRKRATTFNNTRKPILKALQIL